METIQRAGNKTATTTKYFLNNIAEECKISVKTFDTREIRRKSYRGSAYSTTLEKRSNKRTKFAKDRKYLLNLRIPAKEDYSKPISNPFFINIFVYTSAL